MKIITADELKEKLIKHRRWVFDEPNSERANLTGADLTRADLTGANLYAANLYAANLTRRWISRIKNA